MTQFHNIDIEINEVKFDGAYRCDGNEIDALAIVIGGDLADFSELLDNPELYQIIYQHNQERISDELGEIHRQEDLH